MPIVVDLFDLVFPAIPTIAMIFVYVRAVMKLGKLRKQHKSKEHKNPI